MRQSKLRTREFYGNGRRRNGEGCEGHTGGNNSKRRSQSGGRRHKKAPCRGQFAQSSQPVFHVSYFLNPRRGFGQEADYGLIMAANAENLLKRLAALRAEHMKWRSVWDDCARYCMPLSAPLGDIKAKSRGGKKKMPIDTTGVDCAEKLAAWLYSSTVYQGDRWFSLKAQGLDAASRQPDVLLNSFLQGIVDEVLNVISSSNFIPIYQQFLRGYLIYGTGVFYSEFDENGDFLCRSYNITDNIYIAENSDGIVDVLFREFSFSARQAVQEFGYANVPKEVRDSFNSDAEKERRYNFVHCVYPRSDNERDRRRTDRLNKAYADVYIELSSKKICREGGHDKFPFCVPRFFNTGEIYGRSASMSAVPALRAINIAMYAYLEGVEFTCRPMIFAPSDVIDDIQIRAGAKNPYDAQDGTLKLWSPSGDLRSPLDFAEMQRAQVQKLFYTDVFQYLEDRKNMTATEAKLRYDEMIQGFSPVLANLQTEFFRKLIERIIHELCRIGRIQVPKIYRKNPNKNEISGFEVIYTTRLDTKIKGVISANMRNFVMLASEFIAGLGNAPTLAAYIDAGKYLKTLADNCDCSVFLLPQKEIEKNLAAQQESQQSQQLMGKIKDFDLQKAPMPGSAMAMMQEGMQ